MKREKAYDSFNKTSMIDENLPEGQVANNSKATSYTF